MPTVRNPEALRKAVAVFGSAERMEAVLKHFYPILQDLLRRDSFATEEIVSIVLADTVCNNEAERIYVTAKLSYSIGSVHAGNAL